MSKDKTLFKSESKIETSKAADILNKVADGLQAGMVTLQNGEDVDLIIPEEVNLEMELEDEGSAKTKKRSLEIEIEWLVNE